MQMFMKRATAFAIDLLILNMIGRVLGAIFWDSFREMGLYAFLVGLFLYLAYFFLFEVQFERAASLGKIFLGLRVYRSPPDSKGRDILISFRPFLLVLPWLFFFHVESLLPEFSSSFLANTLHGGLLGLLLAQLVLSINKRGDGFHDFVTGTLVSDSNVAAGEVSPFSRPRRAILVGFTGFFALFFAVNFSDSGDEKFGRKGCEHYQIKLIEHDLPSVSGLWKKSASCLNIPWGTNAGNATVFARYDFLRPEFDCSEATTGTIATLKAKHFSLEGKNELMILCSFDYDIGVYSSHVLKSASYDNEKLHVAYK